MGSIVVARAYDADEVRGYRILVDRLWPRGISKERLRADLWAKDAAPSNEIRKAFGHDPEKFLWFRSEYLKELDAGTSSAELLRTVSERLSGGDVVLLYAAKDPEMNNAVVLKEWLEARLSSLRPRP